MNQQVREIKIAPCHPETLGEKRQHTVVTTCHCSDNWYCSVCGWGNIIEPCKCAVMNELTKNVTRVEVIDDKGRSYTNYEAKNVQLSFQDDNRTLKIFCR